MLSGMLSRVGQRKHVLDGGAHWRHLMNTIELLVMSASRSIGGGSSHNAPIAGGRETLLMATTTAVDPRMKIPGEAAQLAALQATRISADRPRVTARAGIQPILPASFCQPQPAHAQLIASRIIRDMPEAVDEVKSICSVVVCLALIAVQCLLT